MANGGAISSGFGLMSQGTHEGIGGITNLIASFFQKNPYAKMSDIYKQMQGYITPYTDAGKTGLAGLLALEKGAYGGMADDPTELEDKIMGKYQESPYAQYQTKQLIDAANSAAAASGQLGTPQEQQELAAHLQGLVSQDQQKYYQNAMQGLNSLANLYGGQVGAGEFGVNKQDEYLQNMANLAGGKTQWANKLTQSRAGDVGSFLESFADVGLGGAEAMGGMMGGGAGGGLMGLL